MVGWVYAAMSEVSSRDLRTRVADHGKSGYLHASTGFTLCTSTRIRAHPSYSSAVLTSRQAIVVGLCVLLGCLIIGGAVVSSRGRYVPVGLSFEPLTYDGSEAMTAQLGGPLTSRELEAIRQIAREEVTRAFAPFRVTVFDDAAALYHVRVVQEVRSAGAKYPEPAGASRSIPGIGGDGVVNFRLLVSNAVAFADPDTSRDAIVAAIGRGVGRAAAHEITHQLLGTTPADDDKDVASYEYRSSFRREQYYGELHWGMAEAALRARIGVR